MSRIYLRRHNNCKTWCIDYKDPKTGRRVRRAIGSKKLAEIAMADIRLKIVKGEKLPDVRFPTAIAEYAERYFAYVSKVNRPITVKADRNRFNIFHSFCKSNNIINLVNINPSAVYKFQTEYMSDHARKSWNNMLTLIKAMLNRAVEWEVIERNPISKIKALKIDRTFHFFSKEEIELILTNAPEPLLTAVMVLLYTGIRRSELWQLSWKDIDLRAKKLYIKPSEGYSTKSRDMRSIPLSAPLHAYLMHKKGRPDERLCSGFANIHSIRRQFVKLLRSLGVKGTLHDLRHTFASHLAMRGVPIPVIKELLGHRDISTTMIYAHLSPETHREAIGKLNF